MDKLEYIKLELEDGSYSDSIPLAVDADAVTIFHDDSYNLNTELSVLEKKADTEVFYAAKGIDEMVDETKAYVNLLNGYCYYNVNNEWIQKEKYLADSSKIIMYSNEDCKQAFIQAMQNKANKYGLNMIVNGPAGYSDDRVDNQISNGRSMVKLYAIASGYDELCKIWNTSEDMYIYSKGEEYKKHLLHSSVYGYNDGSHYANSLTDYYDMLGGKTGSGGNLKLIGAIIKGPDKSLLCGWVRKSGAESSQVNRFSCLKILVDIAYAKLANPHADVSELEALLVEHGTVGAEIIQLPKENILLYEKSNLTSDKYGLFIYGYNDTANDRVLSNTKVLTAITALDYMPNLNEVITFNDFDVAKQSGGTDASPIFSSGEKFTFKELLYAMMMPSSNRAAQAIARHVGNKLLNMKYNGLNPWEFYTLSSIEIQRGPNKTEYYLGDTIDTTGLLVRATFTNTITGATKKENITDVIYSPQTAEAIGTQPITVAYKYNGVTKTANFNISVLQAPIYNINTSVLYGSFSGASQITYGQNAVINVNAQSGYALPYEIEVSNAQYTYDRITGKITLFNPVDNIDISITCVGIQTYNITTNVTNGSYLGPQTITTIDSVNITIYPNEECILPDMIVVVGAIFSYDKISGVITLTNPSEDVFIYVTCLDASWLDEYLINGQSYRHVFVDNNLIQYGNMITDDRNENWNRYQNYPIPTITEEDCNTEKKSWKCFSSLNLNTSVQQYINISPEAMSHIFYLACKRKLLSYEQGTHLGLWIKPNDSIVNSSTPVNTWKTVSNRVTELSSWQTSIFMGTGGNAKIDGYVDDLMVLDLTNIFGEGQEPTKTTLDEAYSNFINLWSENISDTNLTRLDVTYIDDGTPIFPVSNLNDLKRNLIVKVYFIDGTFKTLNANAYSLSGDLSVGGVVDITVTYKNKTGHVNVTVSDLPSITSFVVTYNQDGDTVSPLTQLETLKTKITNAKVVYGNNVYTKILSSSEYTLSGTLTVGLSTITATYENATTTFDVTVDNLSYQTGYLKIGNPEIDENHRITSSALDFIKTPFIFDNNGQSWEFSGKAMYDITSQSLSSNSPFYDIINFIDNTTNESVRGFLLEMNGNVSQDYNKNLGIYVSNTLNSWNIVVANDSKNAPSLVDFANQDFYFRTGWTGNAYYIELSRDGITWDGTYRYQKSSSTNVLTGYPVAFGNARNRAWGRYIYLDSLQLKINNQVYWKAI